MDRMADDDIGALLDLTRQLRGQLLRHAMLGAWAAPGGASPRLAVEADPGAPEAMPLDAPPSEPVQLREAPARLAAPDGPAEPAIRDAGAPAHADRAPILADDAVPVETDDAPVALGRKTLPQIRAELGDCTRCKLHGTRRSIVFGVGSADTPLMFVGEAPGEQEDRRGEPFVGPAGQLLDRMIEAMGWTRSAVYIANTTKCRPPNNRNPQPDELAQCMPFLHAQIAAIRPRIIVALGRPASNQLLENNAPISALRGRFHDYARATDRVSLKIMPTFHPAYLLRDPDKKRLAWSDLKLVMAELARLGIASPQPARG
jgi:uracil-DNA glycosylase family 4